VTIGRRVRSVAAERALEEEGWRMDPPPEVRDRDIVRRRRWRVVGSEKLILTGVLKLRIVFCLLQSVLL